MGRGSRGRTRGTAAAAVVAALVLGASGTLAAAEPGCEDAGGVGYLCGLNNPEDLLRVPGSPFVLVGDLGNIDRDGGGFSAVDVRTLKARDVPPDFSGPVRPEYRGCPGPPDPERFSSHGLDLRSERVGADRRLVRTLLAVNHGGREAIEAFRVDTDDDGVRLTWLGCALVPGGVEANSVTALPDGGWIASVPLRSEAELPAAALGQPTGDVLRWSVDAGWRPVPGARVSFPNGVLATPDGRTLYVAGYTERTVTRVALDAADPAPRRSSVAFGPDNVRFGPRGEVLVTGQDAPPAEIELTCLRTTVEVCPVPTVVAELDRTTLAPRELLRREADARFGGGTSAIVVGGELWVGSFRAQRVLRVGLSRLAGPLAADPGDAAELRLTRRCVAGGRLRVVLTGDVERVRSVAFRFGRRTVARDTTVPFGTLLPRRTVRRTSVRTLRAVVVLRDGPSARRTITRTLPRCG